MSNNANISASERVQSERDFFNEYARQLRVEDVDPLAVFRPSCLENVYLLEQFGDLTGKAVLDVGCGKGDTSVYFALKGAQVHAIDVSDTSVEFTQKLAAHHGVAERVRAKVLRIEDLRCPDESYDLIFADGVLHHVEIAQAVPNLVRILKRGGRGYFIEPQKGSVLIRLYRVIAGKLRSANERPLDEQDLNYLAQNLPGFEHREFHFFSLVLFGVRFFLLKLKNTIDPLWMDAVREGQWCPHLLLYLQKCDQVLLTKFSKLRKYCWMTIIQMHK